ncbi:MAG TPA: hypothetical protein DHV36_01635 [Desulfobacteraceae bacterium]|nr:hypothetical protein [Desulfobacteraceae bacterium]
MNNIASALQEMNRQRAADLSAREMDAEEIAAQTARAITMNDTDLFSDADPFDDDLPPFDDDGSDLDIEDLEAAFDAQDPDPPNQESQARENQQQGPIELEDIVEDDFSSNDTLNEDPSDTDDFDIDDISLPLDLLDPESPDDIHAETDATAGEPEIIDLDSPADPLDDLSALIDTVSETIPDTDDTQADNLEGLLGDDPELPELDDLFAEGEENAENLSPDDLYSLVDETDRATQALPDTDIDDLSSLVDEPEMSPEQDLDDLSLLVDTKTPSLEPETLDDLSLLVDPPESPLESPLGAGDLDDLSLLVDTAPTADATDLDDLSLLVDMPEPQATSGDMDDLSLLVQDEPFGTSTGADDRETTTDNLWDLVKDEKKGHDQNMPMDDLSALVDAPEDDEQKKPERPSLKPDITPEENLNAYKAAVMKIIIDLKSQGLTPEETTDRLNGDGVATLSGKPKWAQKAIAKIYGYIDSAK